MVEIATKSKVRDGAAKEIGLGGSFETVTFAPLAPVVEPETLPKAPPKRKPVTEPPQRDTPHEKPGPFRNPDWAEPGRKEKSRPKG